MLFDRLGLKVSAGNSNEALLARINALEQRIRVLESNGTSMYHEGLIIYDIGNNGHGAPTYTPRPNWTWGDPRNFITEVGNFGQFIHDIPHTWSTRALYNAIQSYK